MFDFDESEGWPGDEYTCLVAELEDVEEISYSEVALLVGAEVLVLYLMTHYVSEGGDDDVLEKVNGKKVKDQVEGTRK